MLTYKLIRHIAKCWVDNSCEFRKIMDLKRQISDMFKSYAEKTLTEDEKNYIKLGLPFDVFESIPLSVNSETAFQIYIKEQYPALSLLPKHYHWRSEVYEASGREYTSSSLPLSHLNLPKNIFYNEYEDDSFNKFFKENPDFINELAKLVSEYIITQNKMIGKAKLIIDELKTLNLSDLKKYYKELYEYAKKA